MSAFCDIKNEISCEEALFFAPERLLEIQEDLTAALRVIRCKSCDDYTEVLITIEENLRRLENLLRYIRQCTNRMEFTCSPYRVYSQILESISLVEGASGLVYYALKYSPCVDYCEVIQLLHEALRLVSVAYRFMQNVAREFIE